MKKIMFWLALIGSIIVLIGSCSKSDSTTTTATTTSTDNTTTTLSAPAGATATLGYFQVAVDWTAVSGASSYTVYWGTSTGISSTSTAITGITDDNYTHSSLDNGTTYFYKVAAVDSAGTGSLSSEVSAIPRDAPTVTEACTDNESASGTLQGLKIAGASGSFYHSWYGASPSNGCIDNSSAISAFSSIVPSDSKSVKHSIVITDNGGGTTETWHFYSDTACAVETGFLSVSSDNLSASDNITIAGPPSGYPTVATKVYATKARICLLAETSTVETKIESVFSGAISLTKGTVSDTADSGDNQSFIWTVLDNVTGQTINWFYSEDNQIANTYPDNFTNNNGTTWHAGDNITR